SITGNSAFSIGPVEFYGDGNTLSVGDVPYALTVPEPYVTVSSSLREISCPGINLFLGVFPGGPSDNILSYYYSNQFNTWYSHEYYDLTSIKEVVHIVYQ
ncbi:MAG: penicillin acylase family protein, partial [Thermoplasmata archaeon]